MIRIKIEHSEVYKDINDEKGMLYYSLPDKITRKRIYIFGIKILDRLQNVSLDSKTYLNKAGTQSKGVGFGN